MDDHARLQTTISELERLSSAFVNAINERDFNFEREEARDLVHHLAPDWRAQLDTYAQQVQPLTFPEQIVLWRQRAQENPDVHFQILHILSDVNEHKGIASVYVEMEVSGISNVKLQAMNELKWRRRDNTWLCYYVIGMRGSSASSDLG